MVKNQELTEMIRAIKFRSNITQSEIAAQIGVSKQYLSDTINGRYPFTDDLKQKLYGQFTYLRQKEGTSSTPIIRESDESGIPFYKDMPVSARAADLQLMDGNERQAGFIQIAGIKGKYAFPVVGCSMEPVIHPGDIIVVDPMDRYETIDPDKIYMIITDTDRMIKHIEMDENDNEKLWCVSPNYKRFAIQKADVKGIYRITFYGRLA